MNEGPVAVLPVPRVALAAVLLHAPAHSSPGPAAAPPLLHVIEVVPELLDGAAVLEGHGFVGEIPPVRPGSGWDTSYPRINNVCMVCNVMVAEHRATVPYFLLPVCPCFTFILFL